MEINDQSKKISLRSEEITEIMGIPPKWITRWGITIIFIVIATVFIGSAFFRYPDIVVAPVIISSENPPSVITPKANGKITDILCADGSSVKKGDTLAVIENSAKTKDVEHLSRIIQGFHPNGNEPNLQIDAKYLETLKVGDIQNQLNSFLKAYHDLQLFLKQNYHEQKIKAIESEIRQYNQYYNRLWSQRNLSVKDLALTQKQFSRDSQLYKSGVISAVDYERSQAALLSKQQSLETARLNLSNTAITIENLKQNIIDTRLEQESQSKNFKESLIGNYNQLISTLSTWEKLYLLIAPSSGILTYMNVWSNLQEVKAGDRLFTINPENRGEIVAKLTLPFSGAGKVKLGQPVCIKLDGYPYMEFGIIEGSIQSISGGSLENGFPVTVSLKKGTLTSYGEKLNFERELTGVAEITTEDLSLLQRFFSPLKYILKSKVGAH
jgi:multidrug resistance efflux pump